MNNTQTLADLMTMLSTQHGAEELENNKPASRIVIYARKSNTDEDKQAQSVPDQVHTCEEYAKKNNLPIVEVITEAESAKTADKRLQFAKMMDGLRSGKYDGVLAWHPDRLARNMREAGELIDMLDKRIIKDMHFCSFQFSNSTMGKVMLGIAFVLSKQYSDNLSENVKRGNKRSVSLGKVLGRNKHGYYPVDDLQRPNGRHWLLVKEAWHMRLRGATLQEVAQYLNDNGYQSYVASRGGNVVQKMTSGEVGKLFKNTFYAGLMKHGSKLVNLFEVYDFEPMVTVEEYLKLNPQDAARFAVTPYAKRAVFLQGKVTCGHCGRKMVAGITPKKAKDGSKTQYYYLRCTNDNDERFEGGKCPRYNKSMRGHHFLDAMVDFFRNHAQVSPEVYDHYVAETKKALAERLVEHEKNQKTLINQRVRAQQRIQQLVGSLAAHAYSKDVAEEFEREITTTKAALQAVEEKIAQGKLLKDNQKALILSSEQLIKLWQSAATAVAGFQSLDELEAATKNVFLNWVVIDGKVASYTLNSPFKEMVESGKLFVGSPKEN